MADFGWLGEETGFEDRTPNSADPAECFEKREAKSGQPSPDDLRKRPTIAACILPYLPKGLANNVPLLVVSLPAGIR
jgi:hypothetical protein